MSAPARAVNKKGGNSNPKHRHRAAPKQALGYPWATLKAVHLSSTRNFFFPLHFEVTHTPLSCNVGGGAGSGIGSTSTQSDRHSNPLQPTKLMLHLFFSITPITDK